MIDQQEWDRLRAKADAVQRGTYLTSDRVANRLFELVTVIQAVPSMSTGWTPENWERTVRTAPDVARVLQESVDELAFLLDQIDTEQGPTVIDAGMPVDVTSEVEG